MFFISRWLSSCTPADDEMVINKPMVHWCSTVCGPVGNCGGCHVMNQVLFNSVKWLESQSAVLGGFIVHADEYVNCIQIIGNQQSSETGALSNGGFCLSILHDQFNLSGTVFHYIIGLQRKLYLITLKSSLMPGLAPLFNTTSIAYFMISLT